MSITINIFGDFVPINRGIKAVKEKIAISDGITKIIRDADYNIINFECPVVSHQKATPIQKDGPNLKCSKETVEYLKDVGFNMVTLANNHFKDYGETGIKDTFEACNDNGIEWVGAGLNIQEARTPKIIEIKGKRIGIVNVCENESSIATEIEAGSNPIDEINNYYDICELKKKTDKIIVIIHGGTEHYNLPTPRMKKRCHFYADLGVAAIVCHHTHCYSGYEVYHNVPIFYSLGNFFFDRIKNSTDLWHIGYFVRLSIETDDIDFQIAPYVQCKDNATVLLLKGSDLNEFNVNLKKLNDVLLNDDLLESYYNKWFEKRYRSYISTTMTWANKYYKSAYRRKLLPALISGKNAILLLNYIRCQSHQDLLVKALHKYSNNT